MRRYLIDVNLPRYFSLWSGEEYEHVVDIDDGMKDIEIWYYAKQKDLTIVTRDADFSELMLLNKPPPRVIHIRYGNMKMRQLHHILSKTWDDIRSLGKEYKLVTVYRDRMEGMD